MENIVTKSKFAEIQGVNKSTVTRWNKAGRLVLANNGKVIVDESIKKLKITRGGRLDVSKRHADNRDKQTTQENNQANEQASEQGIEYYKAIKQDMINRGLKLNEELTIGTRLNKKEYSLNQARYAMKIKTGIENLIDNLAPQLFSLDKKERQAKIQQEIQQLVTRLK